MSLDAPSATPPSYSRPVRRWRRRVRRALVAVVGVLAMVVAGTVWQAERATRGAHADVGRILVLPGADLQVTDTGARADGVPTLVLLHGWTESLHIWDEVLPRLGSSIRVVRVDLPGHGGSASPRSGYGVPDQARQVARALDALHVRGATVAGHSMGGDVGVQLAASRPELVDRLVLLDTPTSAGGVHGSLLVRSSLWPVIGPLVNVWAPDPLKRLGAAIAVAPGAHVPADMVRDVDRMRWPAYQGSFDATMAWVADEAVDRRLRALDVPVLVVWGDRDQLADPGMADRYRRLPGAQVVMLHGVGHTPPVEAPEATAALLAAFSASEPVPR